MVNFIWDKSNQLHAISLETSLMTEQRMRHTVGNKNEPKIYRGTTNILSAQISLWEDKRLRCKDLLLGGPRGKCNF